MYAIALPGPDDFTAMAEIYNNAVAPFYDVYTDIEKITHAGMRYESAEALREEFKRRQMLCVKDENGTIHGYAVFRQKNDQVIWLSALYIKPDRQRNGAGAFLLWAIEESASGDTKIMALETHLRAEWAINFYLKNGYAIVNNFVDQYPYHFILDQPPVPNRPLLAKVIDETKRFPLPRGEGETQQDK